MKFFEDDYSNSSGLGRGMYILSWPIRKFYIVVPILALLYVTPVFFEANPKRVHVWYKDKAVYLFDKTMEVPFINASIVKVQNLLGIESSPVKQKDKGKSKKTVEPAVGLVEMHKPRTKVRSRKGFGVSDKSYVFELEKKDLSKEENKPVRMHRDVVREENFAPLKASDVVLPEKSVLPIVTVDTLDKLPDSNMRSLNLDTTKKKLPLVYMDQPKDIVGEAQIKNANELEIRGLYILLYGIYQHPLTNDGKKAQAYLEGRTKGKKVRCTIVAYTHQKIATGFCFVDGENLNESLVKQGVTTNIAL